MRGVLIAILFLFPVCFFGQSGFGNVPMHRYAERTYQKYLTYGSGISSIRPYRKQNFSDVYLTELDSTFSSENEANKFEVNLLSDIEFGVDLNRYDSDLALRGGAGTRFSFNTKNKFVAEVDYVYNYVDAPSYIDSAMSQMGVAPGFGRVSRIGDAFGYHQVQGYAQYQAGKFFNLEIGNGKNFIGDGYRSILLSDVANNYPYFKITTSVWKVKYMNLFTRQRHIYGVEDTPSQFKGKFTATHYLAWDVSKRVNVGLFESIVWQAEDTLLNRGFDFNYLNPIIFYRPVEFQQGSADNALMGLNVSVNVGKAKLYGQFVIDEFLLAEIKADSGWWANKYGVQIGVKAFDVIDGLDLQTELSSVKPYTYSHGAPAQNYGHDNIPLANPYGSNYVEWMNFITFRKSKWIFEEQFSLAMHGEDSIPSVSYGGNIYQSYSNRPYNYGHFTGQGARTRVFYHHLRISYLLHEKLNMRAEFGHVFRERKSGIAYETNHYFYIGLKTNLWNRYNDY